MKGNVIGFDPDTNTGAISGHDGNRYDFATADWRGQGRPRHGDVVDFQPQGQRASQVYLDEPSYVSPTFGAFYFSPAGRISRSQFWLRGVLPIYGISFFLYLLMVIAAAADSKAAAGIFGIIYFIYALAALWPSIAVPVKRIHDRNKSGWFILFPLIAGVLVGISLGVAIVGAIMAAASGSDAATGLLVGAGAFTWILMLIYFGISIWFFVEFGCLRGTIGANRFGPDPVR